MYELKLFVVLFSLSLLLPLISSSDGDRSPFYQKCLQKCKTSNCTSDGVFTREAAKQQEFWDRMLLWGCEDECRYHCMWRTVHGYQERGYQIPKFHGKWPFRRFLGVQEPASAFASVLNLVIHIFMYRKIIKEFSFKDTPMIKFWHCFAWVCIHAWAWSAVFHARDTQLTEFMDYACALSMVMSLLVAAVVRYLGTPIRSRAIVYDFVISLHIKIFYHRGRAIGVTVISLLMLYFVEHVRYLFSGRIDYDYNMRVNVFFGVTGSLLWLLWCWRQYATGRRYVHRLVWFTLLSGLFLTMELFDFPPRHGWDAHALWHLTTALLPGLFYRFVIEDLRYLRKSSVKSDVKLP